MYGRRLRGILLGIVVVGVNILLVATLVVATSSRSVSGFLSMDTDDPASTQATSPARTPSPLTSIPGPAVTGENGAPAAVGEQFATGDPLSVVVLGDQTGTHEDDWVQAWARTLAQVRPVSLLSPRATDPTIYEEPVSMGAEQPGPGNGLITIRNASIVGASPGYVAPRLPLLVPEDTDVAILSFGRSNSPTDIETDLSALSTALRAAVPTAQILVVVQPPRQDGEPVLDGLVRDWAEESRLATIDVAAEFAEQGIIDETVSTRDPLSVNILGGLTWAGLVQDAVFGPLPESGE
ncbi:MAG: hypothetical protein LC679_04825 [Intrasporangiaceae bacterium]|nr:hypothetical protein [Intrasporangiaceae bacterium]